MRMRTTCCVDMLINKPKTHTIGNKAINLMKAEAYPLAPCGAITIKHVPIVAR